MRKGRCRQAGSHLTWMLLAATVAWAVGCRPEAFRGGLGATAPEPAGSGGAGVGIGGSGGDNGGIKPIPTGTGGDAGSGGSSIGSGGVTGSGGSSIGSGGVTGSGGSSAGTGGMGTNGDAIGGSGGAAMDAAPGLVPMTGARDASTEDAGPVPVVGAGDAAPDAAACVNGIKDLSNIGTGNFQISFRVATTQIGWVALVNQRSTCYFGVFWDIRMCGAGGACPNGALSVETDDKTSAGPAYQSVHSTVTINDGNPHDVVVARVSGVLTIQIDGALSGMGASSASLGAMPALRIGTDVCGAGSSPPTAAFAGTTLSDPCITSP
jgi:hypothetical protein